MIWKRENWKSLVLLSTLFYGAGLAREIFKSPWWCDWGVSPHLTPSPFQRGWRRLNSLFFPSSLASGRAESKLHRQVSSPPPRSVQALDAEASLVQHLLSLHGPSDHASTPGAAHTTGPGAAEQTARSAAWRHWTELGARVGGPKAPWNSGGGDGSPGGRERAGPSLQEAGGPQAVPWSPSVPDPECSGRPSLSLCAFQVRSSASFRDHAGAAFFLGSQPAPWGTPRATPRPLPVTLPLLLSPCRCKP